MRKLVPKPIDIVATVCYNVVKIKTDEDDMKIISSQRYLDSKIINAKIAELGSSGQAEIVLTAWDVKDYDCAILSDGHHTFEAAQQLGIDVRFEIVSHPEGISGDNLLAQAWMDSDWYDIETGQSAF